MNIPNGLIEEKSPYLLLHAHNPIKWYPWNAQAFDDAKKQNKPILLSIGYSACYYCHKMARESFEDEEIAKILNEHFISIKVDKEERPDIDNVYMSACQVLNGDGGWPLNVFLTPNKKPFFAITYLPKEDTSSHIGFKTLLFKIIESWQNHEDKLRDNANKISEFLNKKEEGAINHITKDTVKKAAQSLIKSHDKKYGGFGFAPKFPMPHICMFLLKYYLEFDDEKALKACENTLLSIYKGGIHDHIGGGYFRYSTDEKWIVPHFEKMLYDNALLAIAFAFAFSHTKKEIYKEASIDILNFLNKDMKSPFGAFYSSLSAETKDGEGYFYLFDKEEVEDVLKDKHKPFCSYYNIGDKKTYKNKCIPYITEDITLGRFKEEISRLLKYREKNREKPNIDKKILTSQNALAICAFAICGKLYNNKEYIETAKKAFCFILNKLHGASGRLLARYIDNESKFLAYADDYAFLIWAAICLYEAKEDEFYLNCAKELTDSAIMLFWSEDGGLYFYGADAEKLITRPKEAYDGATPSANSVFAYALNKLYKITNMNRYKEKEIQVYNAFANECNMLSANHTFLLYSFLN